MNSNVPIKRILIIQTAFLGDVILVTPLIKAAKDCFADAKIDALVTPQAAGLLENNPHLNQIISYDKRGKESGIVGIWRVSRKINREAYDLVLVPHRSLRSAIIAWFSGAKLRVGFDTSAGAFLLTHKIPYLLNCHEVDRNVSLIEILGVRVSDRSPQVFPGESDAKFIREMLSYDNNINGNLVTIAPGSIWATKRWPVEYFKTLISKLVSNGINVILIGGEADKKLCRKLVDGLGERAVSTAGRLSLLQSAELMRRSRVLVSNDSAPQHLATAVGTPVIAIFGSTIPAFGFYPYGPKNSIIEQRLSCRPCGMHGRRECPLETFDCMRLISPEAVFRKVLEYL
jgi:heptosyltransferase-2